MTFQQFAQRCAKLTVPAGDAARLLDEVLPADAHYAAVEAESDPDLATR